MILEKRRRVDKNTKQQKDLNSLLNVWKALRMVWQILGVVPIMGTTKMWLSLQRVWCLLVLMLIWLMCLNEIRYLVKYGTTITKGFYACEMISYIFIVSSIYYITIVKRTEFLKIYKKFASLYELLKMCPAPEIRSFTSVYRKLKREVVTLTLLLIAFYLLALILNLKHFGIFNMRILRKLCSYFVPNILISTNLCLYWLALRVIALSYSHSNGVLKSFQNSGNMLQSSASAINIEHIELFDWYQREFYTFNYSGKSFKFLTVFRTLSEINANLNGLMDEVVDIFRFVLILNVANSFIILAIQYFAVYKFFDSIDMVTLLVLFLKFVRIAVHTFNIILILLSHNIIINEKCNTIYILNSLPTESMDMEKDISRYLLQLIARKHAVSLCNMFELDLPYILSIVSALAAFVIFLIQIDLGNVSIEERIATNAS